MATMEQFQERLRRAVREALQNVLAEGDLPETQEGEARFTTIETLALAAGDAISTRPRTTPCFAWFEGGLCNSIGDRWRGG
jgi:hypothetical protein